MAEHSPSKKEGPLTKSGAIAGIVSAIAGVVTIIIAAFPYLDSPELAQEKKHSQRDEIISSPSPEALKPEVEPDTAPIEEKPKRLPELSEIGEYQPLYLEEAKTQISASFQNVAGQEFVRLVISPNGYESKKVGVMVGYDEKFQSSAGKYLISILNIDYERRKIFFSLNEE